MVPEIKRILFTSDLSETSKHAFRWALSLAGSCHAKVFILYVIGPVPVSGEDYIPPKILQILKRRRENDARDSLIGKRRDLSLIQSELKEFHALESSDADDKVGKEEAGEIIIAEGDLVHAITKTADLQNCDAIILGSRRRGALSEGRLGKVIRGVLKHSDRLVIVAPPILKKGVTGK